MKTPEINIQMSEPIEVQYKEISFAADILAAIMIIEDILNGFDNEDKRQEYFSVSPTLCVLCSIINRSHLIHFMKEYAMREYDSVLINRMQTVWWTDGMKQNETAEWYITDIEAFKKPRLEFLQSWKEYTYLKLKEQ